MTQIVRNFCAFAPEPIDPAADWIEIMPVGEFRTTDGRSAKPFRLDPADVAAIIARSMAQASNGELLIDFDHRSMAPQSIADTRAAGWIKGLKLEGERVMASVVWTPEGRWALRGRSYRFISPVFNSLKSDGCVVLIVGAGLVNETALPQLRQLVSALKETQMDPIEQIAGLLGLPADKPDDIVARVTALATAETQLASITTASFESWAASAPLMVDLGGRKLAGKQPPAVNPDKLNDVERQMASAMGVSEEAFLATRNAERKGA